MCVYVCVCVCVFDRVSDRVHACVSDAVLCAVQVSVPERVQIVFMAAISTDCIGRPAARLE